MLEVMYKLLKGASAGTEMASRERARRALMNMSDYQLEDAGISRALLSRGVDAWPWQDSTAQVNDSAAPAMLEEQRKAA